MTGRLEGKVALVTGAAGSIGAASARAMAAEGARLVLSDRDEEGLGRIAAELGADRSAHAVAEARDSAAVAAAVALAGERFGGLDVAFVNAGIFGSAAPIAEYPEDVFREVIETNVIGPFIALKHVLAAIADGGSVILNSSVVGLTVPEGGISAYATSKHALVGLMRTAMREAAPRGVRVNTIHPGPVDNDFQHAIEMSATGAPRERAAELFEQNIPLARHASPQEIAAAVVFLAGDGSRFITGATIPVDGGMSV
jgi:NAD(P)-dependent dehydrogenase (short-subunit alcohol dehydrogenase family)